MATNQAGIPVIIQGAVNPPINQNQQLVVGGQTDQNTFPVIRLKICGGMQIGCGILSIIGVILDVIVINSYEYKLFHNTIQTYLTIVVVICSIGSAWFIMTGCLPLFMTQQRVNSWRGLRVGFMVCSIIGASLIVPIMLIMGSIMLTAVNIYRNGEVESGWIFRLLLPFVEFVLTIVSASCCCCCTPWGNQDRSPGFIINPQQTQIAMNYQPHALMTTGQPVNPTVQYQNAQQCGDTTYQQLVVQQPVLQQPEKLNIDNPPEYTNVV